MQAEKWIHMKSALILKTYFWLYNIIRNYGPLTLSQINEMWVKDTRLSEGKPLLRQTFSRYRSDVQDLFDLTIGCDNKSRYYIDKFLNFSPFLNVVLKN